MASVKNIFDISGRAMAAQMIRLNTVASNLANSNNISTTSEGAYRPLKPIFKTIYSNKLQNNGMATVDAINVFVQVNLQRTHPEPFFTPAWRTTQRRIS